MKFKAGELAIIFGLSGAGAEFNGKCVTCLEYMGEIVHSGRHVLEDPDIWRIDLEIPWIRPFEVMNFPYAPECRLMPLPKEDPDLVESEEPIVITKDVVAVDPSCTITVKTS